MARLSDHRVKIEYQSLPSYIRHEIEQFADDYVQAVPKQGEIIYIEDLINYYSKYKIISTSIIMDIIGCIDTKDYECMM